MSIPKRHHFVPQMILKDFADPEGWLYWCRHRNEPGKVQRGRSSELFHKNHLYSTMSESGAKDPAIEQALGLLESAAFGVVQAILEAARRGTVPALSHAQKQLWYTFFLMQWRRTPENQLSCTSDDAANSMIEAILNDLRHVAPDRLDEISRFATPESKARTIRNVRVQSLLGFRAEVMGVLQRRGIAVLRITRPGKQFIIGSRPVIKLTRPGQTDLKDPKVEMWLPIAADVAVGAGRGDEGICLIDTDDGRMIRHLNMSIASQSAMIAAGSATLVRSVSNAR